MNTKTIVIVASIILVGGGITAYVLLKPSAPVVTTVTHTTQEVNGGVLSSLKDVLDGFKIPLA